MLKQYINMIRFRKPWLRVESINFDLSAKSSSTDYNESNKPTAMSLARIGSEKSLVEFGLQKMSFFTFSTLLRSLVLLP